MTQSVRTTGPKGVRFRSRLEARWAAFFTLCLWPWEYEPELGLEGWFPDFALTAGHGVLVEVKPAVNIGGLEQYKRKIERSGAVAWTLLVGASLAVDAGPPPAVGALGWCGMGTYWEWAPATIERVQDLLHVSTVDFRRAQRHWVAAGNALQWRRM